jgi:hypothetical protein
MANDGENKPDRHTSQWRKPVTKFERTVSAQSVEIFFSYPQNFNFGGTLISYIDES